MSNLKIQDIKCERCQIDPANIFCQSCQPFHYFCPRCDTIVHSMRVRASHVRQNLISNLNNSLNTQSMSTNNYSNLTANFGKFNNELNAPKNYKYLRTSTPTKQKIRINNYDNYYGKEYLNEINRIHNKEIEALKYKIDILENNNERLKLNFQNEIKLMEVRINNILKEKKDMEEKYNEIIGITIKENQEKIGMLLNENNDLKEKKRILQENFKEKEEILNDNLDKCNNKIEQLKNELINERKNNNSIKKTHMNKITEIVKNNNNDIKNLNELHKKELNELYYDGKIKNEKLMEKIETSSNKIEFLINENEKLRQDIKKLESDNQTLVNANNNLKIKIEELYKNIEITRDINSNMQKSYEKLKIENTNMKNDYECCNLNVSQLKKELNLLNETYKKKEKDFNSLLEQSEKIRKDFSQNIFNNEELELDNRKLREENDELKKIINSFNNNICYNTYSNY